MGVCLTGTGAILNTRSGHRPNTEELRRGERYKPRFRNVGKGLQFSQSFGIHLPNPSKKPEKEVLLVGERSFPENQWEYIAQTQPAFHLLPQVRWGKLGNLEFLEILREKPDNQMYLVIEEGHIKAFLSPILEEIEQDGILFHVIALEAGSARCVYCLAFDDKFRRSWYLAVRLDRQFYKQAVPIPVQL